MKKSLIFAFVVVIGLYFTGYAFADSKADCIAMCKAAAKMMKEDLGGALCEINKKNGQFYKGDIFVFAWRGPVMVRRISWLTTNSGGEWNVFTVSANMMLLKPGDSQKKQ